MHILFYYVVLLTILLTKRMHCLGSVCWCKGHCLKSEGDHEVLRAVVAVYPQTKERAMMMKISWDIKILKSIASLWQLILCIKLIGLRDAQTAAKILFLNLPVGCFWERLALDLVDWVKKIFLHPCGQAWSNPLSASIEQKRMGEFCLPSWCGTCIFPWLCTSELLVLGPLDSNWIVPSGFLVLQFADNR